jgi:hypothetical protein
MDEAAGAAANAPSAYSLLGGRRVYRERMDARRELAGERRIDQAMTIEPALPLEGLRHDIDPEMRLAAFPVPGMPGMLMGLVDHAQTLWRESLGQLFCDDV